MSILIKGWYEEPTLFYIYNKIKQCTNQEYQKEIEEPKWLNKLKRTYETWQVTQYKDDRNKWEMFNEDIKELIEQWEDELNDEKKQREENERGVTKSLAEQKLRKLIRKTIKK